MTPWARLLRFAGYEVTTEYYTNDAGRQMRLLGVSVYLRMRELCGLPVDWPEDYYHGDYIRDIAQGNADAESGLARHARKTRQGKPAISMP